MQVMAQAEKDNKEITLETAKEALNNIVQEDKKLINPNAVLKAVCAHYSIRQADLKGKRRTKEIVLPRQVAMYLMYEMTGTPYMSIGEFLGNRDHTTAMYGHEKIKTEMENSSVLRGDIIRIKQNL